MNSNTFKSKLSVEETKINLVTDISFHNLNDYIFSIRSTIKDYMKFHPIFSGSFEPVIVDDGAPNIIKMMSDASLVAGVGPTACLAGAIAEFSRDYLINYGSKYSIVDNGGDISFVTDKDFICGIYAGKSSLSGKLGFKFLAGEKFGICSSSATVGFSTSLGKSDVVTVIADNTLVADALATSIGNHVLGTDNETSVNKGLEFADNLVNSFRAVLIIVNDTVDTIGDLPEIVKLNPSLEINNFEEID